MHYIMATNTISTLYKVKYNEYLTFTFCIQIHVLYYTNAYYVTLTTNTSRT